MTIPNLDDCDKGENLLHGQTFDLLREYTFHSYAAKMKREKGDIETARKHEARKESIYGQLPQWARW